MRLSFAICFAIFSLTICFKGEYLKTSISDPLFMVKPPAQEGVAVANQYVIEIYLNEQLTNSFYIPYSNKGKTPDVIS